MRRRAAIAVMGALTGACFAQVDAPPPQPAAEPAPTVVAEFLRAGATRYWPSKDAADAAKPSLLLQGAFAVIGPPPDAAWSPPQFSREGDAFVARIPAPEGSLFFGAGRPGMLPAKVTVNHGEGAPPWIMIVRPGAPVLGILADTTAPCDIEVGDAVTFRCAADFPILETLGADVTQAVGSLAVLTGWMDLPPAWALGYQHADPSLTSPEAVLEAARRLRAGRLSCDGIWPAPGDAPDFEGRAQMNADLAAMGFHSMWRVPTALKPDAPPDMELRTAGGAPVAFPGGVAPDFTRAAARQVWGDQTAGPLLTAGAGGLEVLTATPPADARFAADDDLGGPGGAARYAAVYPTLAARALREFVGTQRTDVRPVVTTDTPAIGVQRSASLWIAAPGDDDDALADSLRRVQAQSMAARFVLGMDIPGARRDSDGSALARWFGVAALMPMLRAAPLDADRSCSPWDFASIDTVRAALDRRARFMPHLYTLVFNAFRFDEPIVRPAWTLDPADPALRDAPLLFLLGPSLLVDARAGGDPPDAAKGWTEFDPQPGLPRLYIRPGTIIPMGPVRRHAGESPLDPLELTVALDGAGNAQGVLYEDDGEGFNYTRSEGRIAYYTAQRTDKDVLVKMARLDGGWAIAKRKLIVRVLLPGGGQATAEFRDALDTHVTLP